MGQLGACFVTTKPVLSSPRLQLPSPCPAITKACLPRPRAPQREKPLQGEANALQPESRPHSPQLEKACTQK